MNILEEIIAATRQRVAKQKAKDPIPLAALPRKLPPFALEKALREPDISFICEVKKASPSKGIIDPEFLYVDIAKAYEEAGAAAISVLTEPDFFLGCDRYLEEIRDAVAVPLLRKDFIIDPYQIEQAYGLGADAVLLICSVLEKSLLEDFILQADSLGLSCLVEVHEEGEVEMALRAGARIMGVNNRNLKTFQVDTARSIRLRKLVPADILLVAESGVSIPEDVALLREHGIDAVLIGETLMRAENKKKALAFLRGDKL